MIFCHQDELNWPLDQGKTLKERFDEIFDSTKFNKALESIVKLYKELQGDIRGMNAEKQTFSILVSEVEAKEVKLQEQKRRLESVKETINRINKEFEPLKQKIEELQRSQIEYKSLQSEEGRLKENFSMDTWIIKKYIFAEKKKIEYNMHKEQYVKLKETIRNIFEGTTEELNMRIQSYDSILIKKNKEIIEV